MSTQGPAARRAAPVDAGFTLLELLVAVTLLGLVFVMLAGGLRLGVAAWEKGGDTVARTSALQTAQRFLRGEIEQMRPLARSVFGRDRLLAVSGTPSGLAFVGPPPSQAVAPSLYLFRVAIEGPAGKKSLVASWQRLQPDMSDYDAPRAVAQSIVLAAGLDDGALSYFGYPARDADPVWQDRWIDRTEMPMLVRIDLRYHRDDPRQWPSLVVAPQIQGAP
jgi:general secretion pathway protein J